MGVSKDFLYIGKEGGINPRDDYEILYLLPTWQRGGLGRAGEGQGEKIFLCDSV